MPGKTGTERPRPTGRTKSSFNEAQAEMPGKTRRIYGGLSLQMYGFNEAQAEMPGKTRREAEMKQSHQMLQ